MGKTVLKFIWYCERTEYPKISWKKKNKGGGVTLLNFKTCLKVTKIKGVVVRTDI